MAGDEASWFEPVDRADWRRWLEEHHRSAAGVWLVLWKQGAGPPPVTLEDAQEEALCFGWIDSKLRRLDERRSVLRFTPRRPGGTWSRSNRERVARLSEAGLAAVAAVQRDGSWTALAAVEELEVPGDLAAALAADEVAARHFAAFSPSVRRQTLWWIASARWPATRDARVTRTVALAARNRTILQGDD
ncbi:MAG TPA: YdeI/OmpD-associated family protein [Thermomicrobiaceae bacterium]|nr:YdeI/OmpD-associated family protein [Thermomicrobiaceae bacterium]